MTIWRLRTGADRRFRSGHPWIYSNELSESPKGIAPGELVELRDAGGKFLARGYGNPASLISFRVLSRDPALLDPLSKAALLDRLKEAARFRGQLGMTSVSHRWIHGEADRLPGLIIDRYRLASAAQVIVVQAHTAGIDRALPALVEAIEQFVREDASAISWDKTAVVIRNDLGVRKLEGISDETSRVVRSVEGVELTKAKILVASASGGDPIVFQADLQEGQKTGFFLDQGSNIQLAFQRLKGLKARGETIRILDLCCYVGQWGTQLAAGFARLGVKVEVTAVDSSATALKFAETNLKAQGVATTSLKADVLKDLGQLSDRSFDLVISDPPALIKGRKDIPTGTHAYVQLNTEVFRVVKNGGAVVCCSCSALLPEDDFLKALSKSSYRNHRDVRWVGRGGQAADHPSLLEFPEGRYLKAWVGMVGE